METPDNCNPLYAQSGCLHSEDDIKTCHECKCNLISDNESDNPDLCKECETLEHIQHLMRFKKEKLFGQFGEFVDCVIKPMFQAPDYESMKILKS